MNIFLKVDCKMNPLQFISLSNSRSLDKKLRLFLRVRLILIKEI
jgi:hypothetical protein